MSNLQETYYKICDEIEQLKKTGVSFDWHDIDLSDLLISDLIASKLSPNPIHRISLFAIQKLKFYAFRQKLKYQHKKINGRLLIFYNSYNQWKNIEPVWEKLKERNLKIHIISTKLHLLKTLPKEVLSAELVIGFINVKHNIGDGVKGNQLIDVINNSLPKLAYLHKEFSKILNASDYKYVLIGNDNTTEGKLLEAIAHQKNIHCGSIQHGSMNRVNPMHGLSKVKDFFVYGERPANELVFLGKSKDEIIISGWPIQEKFKSALEKIRNKKSTVVDADVLICLSGPGHSVSVQHHVDTIDLIAKLQLEYNLRLIVKLHPKDKKEYYQKLDNTLTTIYDNKHLDELGISLIELFTRVKMTVTGASNSALESLLTETPVITLDLIHAYYDVDFIKDGLTHHTTNYNELKNAFTTLSEVKEKLFSIEMKNKIETYYFNYFTNNQSPSQSITNRIMKKMYGLAGIIGDSVIRERIQKMIATMHH